MKPREKTGIKALLKKTSEAGEIGSIYSQLVEYVLLCALFFGSGDNHCDCSWAAITATLTEEAQHATEPEKGA